MKKIAVLIAFACLQCLNSNGQSFGSTAKPGSSGEKCIEEGKSLVDVYYGFPNLYATIYKALITNPNTQDVSVSSFGPIGGKYEYLLTDKIGIGAEFNYSTVTVTFTQVGYNSSSNPVTYHYIYSSPAYRAMVGFNFHFVNTEKVV